MYNEMDSEIQSSRQLGSVSFGGDYALDFNLFGVVCFPFQSETQYGFWVDSFMFKGRRQCHAIE